MIGYYCGYCFVWLVYINNVDLGVCYAGLACLGVALGCCYAVYYWVWVCVFLVCCFVVDLAVFDCLCFVFVGVSFVVDWLCDWFTWCFCGFLVHIGYGCVYCWVVLPFCLVMGVMVVGLGSVFGFVVWCDLLVFVWFGYTFRFLADCLGCWWWSGVDVRCLLLAFGCVVVGCRLGCAVGVGFCSAMLLRRFSSVWACLRLVCVIVVACFDSGSVGLG